MGLAVGRRRTARAYGAAQIGASRSSRSAIGIGQLSQMSGNRKNWKTSTAALGFAGGCAALAYGMRLAVGRSEGPGYARKGGKMAHSTVAANAAPAALRGATKRRPRPLTLLSINDYFYRRGGAEAVYFAHNALCQASGWKVVPFSMRHAENTATPWSAHFVEEIEHGASNSLLGKLRRLPKVLYSLESRRKLSALLARVQPDVAHCHSISPPLVALDLAAAEAPRRSDRDDAPRSEARMPGVSNVPRPASMRGVQGRTASSGRCEPLYQAQRYAQHGRARGSAAASLARIV